MGKYQKIKDNYDKFVKKNFSNKPLLMSVITAITCILNYHSPELASVIIDAGMFSGIVILTLYKDK